MGKLNLVDLAVSLSKIGSFSVPLANAMARAHTLASQRSQGSERQTKTQAEGQRLQEANKINWSLTALGNVISQLVRL